MAYGDKIRKKLELLLEEHGITACDGWNIARGWWLSPQADVQRWQCWATYQGVRKQIGSWDSISECVRCGVSIARGKDSGGYVDVDVMALSPRNTVPKEKR